MFRHNEQQMQCAVICQRSRVNVRALYFLRSFDRSDSNNENVEISNKETPDSSNYAQVTILSLSTPTLSVDIRSALH